MVFRTLDEGMLTVLLKRGNSLQCWFCCLLPSFWHEHVKESGKDMMTKFFMASAAWSVYNKEQR